MKSQKPKENKSENTILKTSKIPILEDDNISCNFYGYNADSLMKETSKLQNAIETSLIKQQTIETHFICYSL